MSTKRPIDRRRDSALSGTIGIDGEGILKEFYNIGDNRLLMIKENAIYEFQLADQIDPGRTNINIPNTQKKLYEVGYSSKYVGSILMTAKELFSNGMLDARFDRGVLLSAALDLFDEIIAASGIIDRLKLEQQVAVDSLQKQQADGMNIIVPSISDIKGKVKSFVQRAEHSIQRILALCQIFYPLPAGKAWFDSFVKAIEAAHSLEQPQIDRIKEFSSYAQFVRNCRHCIEHPKREQKIDVSNFEITAAAEIDLPMIEIVHKDTPHPREILINFMEEMLDSIVIIAEDIMAFLAAYHVAQGWEGQVLVAEYPEDKRRHPHVKYYFTMNMGGALVPIG